jgi:hypothetical protein
MWDVSQTQNQFWRDVGGRDKWLNDNPAPFRPKTGGGAEFMSPNAPGWYSAPRKTKTVAAIGKGGLSDSIEETVG